MYCFVLKGLSGEYKNNIEIKNLNKINLNDNEFIFHGTADKKNKIISNGGRVLNFVIRSKNFEDNRKKIIELINKLDWPNGFYRKDIGYKVIEK